MPNIYQKRWDLILGLIILWFLIIFILVQTLILTDGKIIYSRDDAYIHMAIARNFALYGVWGINKNKFSSTSSSLLYTLLLSFCFLVFGVFDIIPFIINSIFATLIIFFINKVLRDYYKIPKYVNILAIFAIILFVSLPGMIFVGMEHILQTFINLCFVFYSSHVLSIKELENRERLSFSPQEKLIFCLTPLVTMIRFEGIFLILIVSFFFLIRKRIFFFFVIFFLGILPIFIYGVVSMYYGWHFLPNSIYTKSPAPDLLTAEDFVNYFILRLILELVYSSDLSSLLLGVFIVFCFNYYKERNLWKNSNIMSLIFILLTLSHIQFASVIHFRYYAYLTTLGIFIFIVSINDIIPLKILPNIIRSYLSQIKQEFKLKHLLKPGLFFIILFYIINSNTTRALPLIFKSPYASDNIYEQHYQMGLFIEKYYKGECVAVNDIGAVSYLSDDVEILDLWGLGDIDVGDARAKGNYDTEKIDEITKKKNCKIAILNDYFERYGGLPEEWVRVGKWKVKDNVILGDETVFFYAVDSDEVDSLMKNLKDFSSHLPSDIIQEGNYTKI
ncbi:MAG: hypothetical protein ACFFAH_01000 [Promethearchaeota archaeon]